MEYAPYIPERICLICGRKYQPTSSSQKYCKDCKQKNLHRQYIRIKHNLGTCTHCGCKVNATMRWCKSPECQAHKKQFYRLRAEAAKKHDQETRTAYKSVKREEKNQSHSKQYWCIICGEDAFPNRMYCPSCHRVLSNEYADNDFEINAEAFYS